MQGESALFSRGGEVGRLLEAYDWASNPLGDPGGWSQPLRAAVSLVLQCAHPMYIWWGTELLCFYNDAYRRSIGAERHPSSLGRPGREVWAEIWPVIGPQIEHVMSGQGPIWHEDQLVPITRDGKLEDVYWTYSYNPIPDPDAPSGVGGVLVVCSETTATVLAAQRREQELVRQREIFAQAPGFAIVMSGSEHRVDFVNDGHQALFGSADWVGKPIREAFPDVRGQGFFELLNDVYASGQPYRAARAAVRFRPGGGNVEEVRILDFVFAPVFGATGEVTGVFCQGFDVTQHIKSEEDLREREEQLRLAIDAGDVGLWDVDPETGGLYWPARVKAMFGISPDVDVTMADFYAGLHPGDQERVTAAFAAATDPARRVLYDVEYRTVGKEDGLVRWVAAKGRGVFDETSRCVRVIGAALDITERRATQELLRVSEERLRAADRKKDEFLATLAHELRNPLAPIANAAALLQHPSLDPEKATRFAQMIMRQTRAMGVLLDDLLEVSRITTGKLQLKKKSVSVASLVESALEPIRPALESKGHALRVEMDGGEVLLEVDPVRISQVLTNLLNNSIKYSQPGGAIVLRTRAAPRDITIEVQDTGIGLSSEQLPTVFDMFAQVAPTIERTEGGLGIGLAVAKAIVEMHGGRIEAASAGLGQGSTFTVMVPRGEAVAPPPIDPDRRFGNTHAAQEPVVVADDNVDAAESLAALLELDGYAVYLAHDGAEALELARSVNPVACFVDLGMPRVNGYEVARQLRQAGNGSAPLLIATTGWGQAEDRRRALDAGFDVHLTKPIDMTNVLQALAGRPTFMLRRKSEVTTT
jgi:PAS domain S-box-containing protein